MIRNVKLRDLNSVIHIEEEAFEPEVAEGRSIYKERIEEFSDGFLVSEENDSVLGFISSEIWDLDGKKVKKSDFKLNKSIEDVHNEEGDTAYISSFAVNSLSRGKGIGKKLFNTYLEHMKENYDNLERIVLVVGHSWKAKKLYEKMGFKYRFSIDKFFGESTNGEVMVLKLD